MFKTANQIWGAHGVRGARVAASSVLCAVGLASLTACGGYQYSDLVGGRRDVDFDHPVSVRDAMSLQDIAPLRELRFDAGIMGGGVTVLPEMSVADVEAQLLAATQATGWIPGVDAGSFETSRIPGGTAWDLEEQIRERVVEFPVQEPVKVPPKEW